MGKTSFDLGNVLRGKLDDVFILRFEIRTGEASFGLDIRWPSFRDSGRTVEIERGESLDAVLVSLVRRNPFDIRTDDGLGGLGCDQGGGRDGGKRTGHIPRLVYECLGDFC